MVYHSYVHMQISDGSVDFGQSYAMNEWEYHSPIGQLPIEAGDHDQIDKSLRCKINSEWEEREKEVE